ncbi:REF/SRPP-like protein [Hibiscus syriacus]|uniref:REF/SRPP-like protein n=1 Tax=Hibiscus syriacus TaxID=106335 RepID=A0A6A3BMG4_HIBSY|nr:REF/SRPP-like protein At1g67360 [Hibiscus syriacus]KAE8716608.1 REF/SRPP-like protein [Hibiscus syriacus]
MATMDEDVEFENKDLGLKHLKFVRVAAIHALVCVSNLYDYSKRSSGPLRSTVDNIESAVTTVVGPLYQKFKDVPDHLLGFLDNKVDEASHKLDVHVPASAKQVVSHAHDLVQKATQKAQELVDEARTNGPRGALHYAAVEYKNLMVVNSTKLWVILNHNSTFNSVTERVVPKAAELSEKYNGLVKEMSGKGYPVFGYLPLIPVDEFGKAVKKVEAKDKAQVDDHKSDSGSGSD